MFISKPHRSRIVLLLLAACLLATPAHAMRTDAACSVFGKAVQTTSTVFGTFAGLALQLTPLPFGSRAFGFSRVVYIPRRTYWRMSILWNTTYKRQNQQAIEENGSQAAFLAWMADQPAVQRLRGGRVSEALQGQAAGAANNYRAALKQVKLTTKADFGGRTAALRQQKSLADLILDDAGTLGGDKIDLATTVSRSVNPELQTVRRAERFNARDFSRTSHIEERRVLDEKNIPVLHKFFRVEAFRAVPNGKALAMVFEVRIEDGKLTREIEVLTEHEASGRCSGCHFDLPGAIDFPAQKTPSNMLSDEVKELIAGERMQKIDTAKGKDRRRAAEIDQLTAYERTIRSREWQDGDFTVNGYPVRAEQLRAAINEAFGINP